MGPRIAFFMDQIAGHVTNYQNIRTVAESRDDLEPVWIEVEYHKDAGRLERWHQRMAPWVPQPAIGISRGAIEMRRGFSEGPFDAVFSNSSVGVFFSRRFRRVPSLIDFDSTPVQLDRMPTYTPHPDPRPLQALKFHASRSMMQSAHVLHAWSTWAAESAIEEYGCDPKRVVINPPGVDLTRWSVPTVPRTPSVDRPARVLFVGGDFERKGGAQLLSWHATVDPTRFELDIVTRDEVRAGPGVRVHRDLEPNSEALRHLYHQADVFVLPSLGECFGIATIEAMATGLPVVVSDVGATGDIVDDAVNGLVVPAGDAPRLGDAIARIVGDPVLCHEMGLASRRIAERKFDVVTNASRLLDVLVRLATSAS